MAISPLRVDVPSSTVRIETARRSGKREKKAGENQENRKKSERSGKPKLQRREGRRRQSLRPNEIDQKDEGELEDKGRQKHNKQNLRRDALKSEEGAAEVLEVREGARQSAAV